MRKAYFFAAFLLFLPSLAVAQAPMNTAPAGDNVSASAQQLSAAQKEVWAAEESMHRYEQQRDAKRFLSLWDENFVGWPDYEPRPVRKPEIEKGTVEEFQTPQTSGRPLPAPLPEAIGIFGEVAVTHYFWPEADQTSPIVFRTTHTWQKGPQGWQIIGGMACEVPRVVPAQTPTMSASSTAQAEEEKAAAETVRRYEQAVQEYDFAKANSLVAPNAKWIERSLPERADEWPDWWQQAKAAGVRIAYHLHGFETHVEGNVAWVTLTIDGTFSADSPNGQKLLAAQQDGGFFGPAANPLKFRNTFVESEVLVKTHDGWRIALGHTSLLPAKQDASGGINGQEPRLAASKATHTTAKPDDVSSIERIIAASYDALTEPAGTPRQWERYLNLYDPAARFVSASTDAAGHAIIHRWSREEYVAAADDYLVKTGFTDRKLGCVTNQFGNVATVRCGFEGLEQSKLVERGVAMFQLYNDGQRWWILSVVWDKESPDNPIPPELLGKK